MKCPDCGSEQARHLTLCPFCGSNSGDDDLLEIRQLEFLVEQVSGWAKFVPLGLRNRIREPYWQRLQELRARFAPEPEPPPLPPAPVALPVTTIVSEMDLQAPKAAPRAEAVPFDEWLLSERNIKIALYSGALLLVIAGIVFFGSTWGELGGPFKFASILMATSLTYLGGHLLYQRRALQLASLAVLGVASGFLPLNFAVLQVFVLGPAGFRDDLIWLIAAATCLLVYALTAYWTQAALFSFIGIGALFVALAAGLDVAGAHLTAYPLGYVLLAPVLLLLAKTLKDSSMASFTFLPLITVAQVTAPVAAFVPLIGYPFATAWTTIGGLFVTVGFYVATDILFSWRLGRWAAVGLFPVALGLAMDGLHFSDSAMGATLMGVATAYLGAGYWLQRRERSLEGGLPLYLVAYAIAGAITAAATRSVADLTPVLFGDVAILILAAIIHKRLEFAYGAVWIFMLSVYLILVQTVPSLPEQGLFMGLLGLLYVAAGYFLGRGEVKARTIPYRGGPFLSAAVFLSGLVVGLTWTAPLVATLALLGIAGMYLAAAFWLGRPEVLYIVLAAVNLGTYTGATAFSGYSFVGMISDRELMLWRILDIAYTILSLALVVGGIVLRRTGRGRWASPLYVVGPVDMVATYVGALFDWPMAIALSAVYATFLLAYAWLERPQVEFPRVGPTPIATYIGVAPIAIGHFYMMAGLGLIQEWPPYAAALYGVFELIGRALREGGLAKVYGDPLRKAGLVLGALPVAGALLTARPAYAVITVAIFAAVLLSNARVEALQIKLPGLGLSSVPAYLGVTLVVLGHFYIMDIVGFLPDWPAHAAGLYAVLVFAALLLRGEELQRVYAGPLRWIGLIATVMPLAGALFDGRFLLIADTFGIVAATYGVDGALRRKVYLGYLACAAGLMVYWGMLRYAGVAEPQAYVVPLALVILGLGWNERRRGKPDLFGVSLLVGLALLLGTSFVQSLEAGGFLYGIWLGIESLAALAFGVRTRSRSSVTLGTLALVASGVAQFGPGFTELPRWIQLSVTGGILLGGGIGVLTKRDQVLRAQRALTQEWNSWGS